MIKLNSSVFARTALFLLFVSPISCNALGSFLFKGRWEEIKPEDPPAAKEDAPATAKETTTPVADKKPESPEPASEPVAASEATPATPAAQTPPPDPFDGCTKANGSLFVYMGIGVQFAKKTCGLERTIEDDEATLTQGKLVIRFKTLSNPPDIAKTRASGDKLRKIAAENKARVDISISGDSTYTLVSTRATKSTGEVLGIVESDRIIGDEYFRCQVKLEGPDTSMLQTAKQICASMRAMKEK